MNIVEKIFGTHSERELRRITSLVDGIEALRPDMQALSDEARRKVPAYRAAELCGERHRSLKSV